MAGGVLGPGSYYLLVYGCQMNEREAETIAGLLESEGLEGAGRVEDADVVVVHTCCVREGAERKIRGRIGQLQALRSARPGLVLAVGGCMVQQPGAAQRLAGRGRGVDVLYGTYNLARLPELLHRARARRAAARPHCEVELWPEPPPTGAWEGLPWRRARPLRAFVNVSYGCNNRCAYCIVPYVRGPERSRRPQAIADEVRRLVADGYREVTLLGQNVNTYGRDLGDTDFGALLEAVNAVPGLWRIRYTTSHPRDFGPSLIDAVARLDKVCEHFHLPVQSGADRILALMNRGYTREHYIALARAIRGRIPGAAITTDLIVGFPGEMEEDFEATLDLVRRVEFDAAFTFMYSPRPGTPAAAMDGQVPLAVRQERLRRLMDAQYPISLEKNRALVGQEVEVLVEGASDADPERLVGRMRTNRIVHFPGEASLRGRLARVRVELARTFTLEGRLAGGAGGDGDGGGRGLGVAP